MSEHRTMASSRIAVTTIVAPESCPDCGGRVMLVAKAGRTRRTRSGNVVPIPADMVLPTCVSCGSEWTDDR